MYIPENVGIIVENRTVGVKTYCKDGKRVRDYKELFEGSIIHFAHEYFN